MISKELKKELEENYELSVKSENPLTLMPTDDTGNIYIGIPAEIMLKEVQEFFEEENNDYTILKKMNNDDIVLVTANVNYADEFDMSDFTTMSVEDANEMVKDLKAYKNEIEWYFGTNEDFRYENGRDLLRCLSFKKITPEEEDVLDRLFGGSFGEAGVFDEIFSLGDDEDEDYDEDIDESEIEEEKDEYDGYLDDKEKAAIEKLKEFGWKIEYLKDGNFKYTNSNGIDSANCGSSLIMDLLKFEKRRKK